MQPNTDFLDKLLKLQQLRKSSLGRLQYTCVYCGVHRYHLPGQHDQCDHSPTGECSSKSGGVADLAKVKALSSYEKKWRKRLDKKEEYAIKSYAEKDYSWVNGALRGDIEKPLPWVAESVSQLDSALAKSILPIPLDVYRGAVLSSEQLDSITEGNEFADKAFVSTTRSLGTAVSFASAAAIKGNEQRVIFRLKLGKGTAAALIERIGRQAEREVLLPRNKKFRIVSTDRNKTLQGDKGPVALGAVITVEAM